MTQKSLPADPIAMILGIIGLATCITGCCCGALLIIPLILSIIGLVIANKSLKEYELNHQTYSSTSRSNVSTAKILNIVVIACSSLYFIIAIAYISIYGLTEFNSISKDFNLNNNDKEYQIEEQVDSLNNDIIEETTLKIDSVRLKKINKSELEKTSDTIN